MLRRTLIAGILSLAAMSSAHAQDARIDFRGAALGMTLSDWRAASAPEVIIVRDESTVAACSPVGEVRSRSWWGGMVTNYAYGQALTGMKKQAAAKGATHIVLIDSSSGHAGTTMLGQAYRCPPPAAPAAAEPGPGPQS